ncbi:MAG: glycosyltransferase family 2 protein [Candidatus Parcubacteria bacterium]|nr:glycosyltransferase family 2 protein [Candidatus Parcubacteria bacterium]
MPKVAINLVTWNGEKFIENCLNAILKQTFSDYLLLIIDNGSVDQTVKIIEEQFLPAFSQKIKLVKNKNNLGFAFAHNQAILWTDSDYVLVLNQDVILEPNFLEKAVRFLEDHHNAGSISGKILRWQFDQNEGWEKSLKSDIIDSLGIKIFKSHKVVDRLAGENDNASSENVTEIFGPCASCPLYCRKALEDVRFEDEFFDNDFFSYKEDIDLAYRLQWRGWKSYYLPEAIAFHERGVKNLDQGGNLYVIKQRKNKSKFIKFHSYKNHIFILLKNLSPRNFWRYGIYIVFYELKKFLYILIFEFSTLRAWQEIFKKFKRMKIKHQLIMSRRLIKDDEMRKWFN